MEDRSLTKITMFVNTNDYELLKQEARAKGRPLAEVAREAMADYVHKRKVRRALPKSLGSFRSRKGVNNLSERVDSLLKSGFGRA